MAEEEEEDGGKKAQISKKERKKMKKQVGGGTSGGGAWGWGAEPASPLSQLIGWGFQGVGVVCGHTPFTAKPCLLWLSHTPSL